MILETETIGDSHGEILAVDHQPGSSAILIPGCYNPASICSIRRGVRKSFSHQQTA
jgi:hypothetical protein